MNDAHSMFMQWFRHAQRDYGSLVANYLAMHRCEMPARLRAEIDSVRPTTFGVPYRASF